MAVSKKGHNLIVMFKATAATRDEIIKSLDKVNDKIINDIMSELNIINTEDRNCNIEKIIKALL